MAVRQARTSGLSNSGHSIRAQEWGEATEIATFRGHNLAAPYTPAGSAQSESTPFPGDIVIQSFSGADVTVEIAEVCSPPSRPLPPGLFEINDQYGDSHFVEQDGTSWVTIPAEEVPSMELGETA